MAIKLNTAEPTIVPTPMSLSETKTPMIEVNNSGADVLNKKQNNNVTKVPNTVIKKQKYNKSSLSAFVTVSK